LSGADENAGGANGQCPGGPYCSTRDGSPSGNGNGNGNAVGKPCAGCVGKADNKNPQGQMPNGSDHNAGYECDTNHGIGRTNPAHTGCTSTNQPPPECVPTAENNNCGSPPPSNCVPTAENNNCGTPPPSNCVPTAANDFCSSVLGQKVTRSPRTTTPAVLPESLVKTPNALPTTGTDIGVILAGALLTLAAGSTLMLIARRSRLTSPEH